MSRKNDEKKIEIYRFIKNYINENGTSPTTLEICEEFKIAKSTTSKYVTRLTEEGYIERQGRYSMRTPGTSFTPYMMPVIGRVACGKPILAEEDIKGYIPLDESMTRGEYFGLVAEGDSMIDIGVHDGDIVYVKRQNTCDEGDIVVAMVIDEVTGEAEATLKTFYRDYESEKFILHPENSAMDDIIVDEVTILGIAVRVLKVL